MRISAQFTGYVYLQKAKFLAVNFYLQSESPTREDFAGSPFRVVHVDGPALVISGNVLRSQCNRGKEKSESDEDSELNRSHLRM